MRRHHEPAAISSLCKDLLPRLGRQLLIDAGRRRQIRLKDLQRVVDCIPAEDRAIPGIVYHEPHLSAGVPRQRCEMQTRADLMAVVDQIGHARLDDRDDALLKGAGMNRQGATGVVLRHPVGELVAAEQVARVGKGRLPAAIVLLRIPADVIDMQMGAEHQIDFGRIDAGLPQPIEKAAPAPLMPGRDFGNVLVSADATVDQQGFSAAAKVLGSL